MLVYEPGHFFVSHQDSEKTDDMVGSLVVVLPSHYSGGSVVIEHGGERKLFQRSTTAGRQLSLIAFYADCRHEVKPVESGYRIALTYHLILEGASRAQAPAGLSGLIEELARHIETHFSTPPPRKPYATSPPQPPDRLVFLLDHEYTQRGLGWDRLKNADRLRAATLRQAADRLGCEIYLALADVHESWDCEPEWAEDYGWRRRGRYHLDYDDFDDDGDAYEDDDGGDGDDGEDYHLSGLIDSEIELRDWVGLDGERIPTISSSVADDEVCCTTASVDMKPFRSEYEGWMGNYGNTVDRWYHRAAVVMWPKERTFTIRAKSSPKWAVEQLSQLLNDRRADQARQQAASLLPFWNQCVPREEGTAFFDKLLTVAISLDDTRLATGLLKPVGRKRLTRRALPRLVSLIERHDIEWAQELLSSWEEASQFHDDSWVRLLPSFCSALDARGQKELARWLLDREVKRMQPRIVNASPSSGRWGATEGPDSLYKDLIALFECAVLIDHAGGRDELIAALTQPQKGLDLVALAALLRKCREQRTPAAAKALSLETLYVHVFGQLESVLSMPPREPDDWSIAPLMTCDCALCSGLATFLRDPRRVEYSWPLAKERRQHVHQAIDRYALPVRHTTLRRGSPYTLVLKKLPVLFERDAALRKEQKAQLAWLAPRQRDFAGGA